VTSDSLGWACFTDVEQKWVVVYYRDGGFLRAMGRKADLERLAGIAVDERRGRV